MPPLLDAALAYAEMGWAVFPVQPFSKVPLTGSGFHDASTGPKQITAWWRTWPDANVGVATGASGLVVVDLDFAQEVRVEKVDGAHELVYDGVNGLEEFAYLAEANCGGWPATRTVTTPRGGRHLIFTAPTFTVRNSAGKLGPGIDVRAEGGYVVAPPSRTEVGVYELDDDWPTEPAPLPQWLALLVREPKYRRLATVEMTPLRMGSAYGQRALDTEAGRVACAPEGRRNEQLNRSAFALGQLITARELDRPSVVSTLSAAARRAGLDDREIDATLTSGLRSGMSNPRAHR